jgi:hypothetical protein
MKIIPLYYYVDVPKVKIVEWQAMGYDKYGYLTLMDAEGNIKDDVKAEGEYLEMIKAALNDGKQDVMVDVLSAPEGESCKYCNLVEIVVNIHLV